MKTDTSAGVQVLLTGCTGFVGKVVLEELLRRREELGVERVFLLIRPRKRKTPDERFDLDVASSPCFSRLEPGWRDYCAPVAGDLSMAGLGISSADAAHLRESLTHVMHCAASVEFTLPIIAATKINVTGALDVLAFAQSCTRLQRMVDVSTAYVTPHPGSNVPVLERVVDMPLDTERTYADILAGRADQDALLSLTKHANTYTFTKCLAESLLVKRRGDTPLTILRPSIVSACRRYPFPGWIDSRAAYAGFIALMGAGHLRVVRADPDATLDVVPCDDVADRILTCAFDSALQQPFVVRHAVATLANSGTVSKLAYSHERYFQAHPHAKAARWRYLGTSEAAFRYYEWMHHHVPLGAARMATRLTKQKKLARQVDRLREVLRDINEAFHYFVHRTFDFRTAFPPLEDFNLDAYLEAISHGISEHLLLRNPRETPLRMHGTDLAWAIRQPDGNFTVRTLAYVIRKALRAAGAEITFNESEIKAALRHVQEGDLVVLAPSHRSYMDFLVTSLLCFAHPGLGLKLPRIAAGEEFGKIPIIGHLLEWAGAFYIKRGVGKADPTLSLQLAELVKAGHSLEFYAEGTRSRSRRFLAPKRGILRALQETGRPAVLLPLAISYDRVAEEEGFLLELDGGAKHRGGLVPLAKWTMKLLRKKVDLGRIHIRSGTPLRLDLDADVKTLSRSLIAELQRHTVATTFHLSVFCHWNPRLGLDVDSLRAALVRRGGVVLDSQLGGEESVPPLMQRTYEGQWMHLFYADARSHAPENAAVAAHISRNGFWFPEHASFDDHVGEGIVETLFQPICRDFEQVLRAVAEMPVGSTITAHDLLRPLPGVFLREVEDALGELADRGLLSQDRGTFRTTSATREAAELASEYAWQGAHPAAR